MWEALRALAALQGDTPVRLKKALQDDGAHIVYLQYPVSLVKQALGAAWKAQANARFVSRESLATQSIPQTQAHVLIVRRGSCPQFWRPRRVITAVQEDGAARLLPRTLQPAQLARLANTLQLGQLKSRKRASSVMRGNSAVKLPPTT